MHLNALQQRLHLTLVHFHFWNFRRALLIACEALVEYRDTASCTHLRTPFASTSDVLPYLPSDVPQASVVGSHCIFCVKLRHSKRLDRCQCG